MTQNGGQVGIPCLDRKGMYAQATEDIATLAMAKKLVQTNESGWQSQTKHCYEQQLFKSLAHPPTSHFNRLTKHVTSALWPEKVRSDRVTVRKQGRAGAREGAYTTKNKYLALLASAMATS